NNEPQPVASRPAPSGIEGAGGFDALFAGLSDTDEHPPIEQAEPAALTRRAERDARGSRSGRTSAKAEKSAKKSKKSKKSKASRTANDTVAKGPKSARFGRSGGSAPEAARLNGAATIPVAQAPLGDDLAALLGITQAADAAASAGTRSTPATPSTPNTPLHDPVAARAAAPAVPTAPVAAALRPEGSTPHHGGAPGGAVADSRQDAAPHRPSVNRQPLTRQPSTRPAARPNPRTAASAPVRRRRPPVRIASVLAMSFVALLAVATTIPALSLLSPSDVQAMALADATGGHGLDGQRVEVNGDIVAQSLQREGYETQTIDEYARAAGIRPENSFINNPAGSIQWPFAVGVHVGDRFGYRDCSGCSSDHGGQDFNPGLGAEIQAIADGTVSVSTDSGGSLGVLVMIDHMIDGELVTSVYAHMQYDSRRVEVGETVEVGDVLGTTGSTGMSTGPHLHFEIRLGGVNGTKVDPLEWLYANTN
ncbi:MAG: peptidoglycan DD-metalloendopeptidase family protein, partial [Actinomycetota bacterium]|nr:peptidoglycan DD-metalloendopeptidase family protein [Actinomycetota bacterium]